MIHSEIARALETPTLRRRLVMTAVRCGARSETEAEDCVQDGLLLACTTESTPDDHEKLEAWLSSIVANATRMRRRSATRLRRGGKAAHVELFSETVAHVAADGEDPESQSARKEFLALTKRALAAEADADLVLACAVQPDFITKASRAGGLSRETLKSRLRRARKRLREAVAPLVA